MADIFRQEGGLGYLGLAEVDPRLDFTGKSVERLSDPEFRLIALWSCIGQYAASSDRTKVEFGDDMPTIDEARHHQLVSRWAQEARRVYPDIRTRGMFESHEQKIASLIDNGRPLAAYLELIDLRSDYPEFMHPDVRFDLMASIYSQSDDLSQGDIFRPMVLREMLDETRPEGTGYCDNPERLRRYQRLAEWDDVFEGIIANYIVASKSVSLELDLGYFEADPTDFKTTLGVVAERKYAELAGHFAATGLLDIDEEALLLPAISGA